MHRSNCRRASLRRVQHVRHGLQSRRARLSVSVHTGKIGGREADVRIAGLKSGATLMQNKKGHSLAALSCNLLSCNLLNFIQLTLLPALAVVVEYRRR